MVHHRRRIDLVQQLLVAGACPGPNQQHPWKSLLLFALPWVGTRISMQIFTFIGRHYFWRWSHMLSDFDPFFFSPSAIFSAFGDFFHLRRLFPPSAVAPQFFVIFPAKPGESGLGTLLKRTALKFCIEWSNRELLRPSRRRDMSISLFLSAFGAPPVFCDFSF